MRATDFFNEDQFGTTPKRPARAGSRPARGHGSEPRYKSAPVVPGGDNPDAVHKPNKGDEPVERGDTVMVQDPDNIATVHTGTVKRIGREFVYVTLKNGETVAAPHDEVSKDYEVLSKRAHNILNKKGKHVGNYKVSETKKLTSREKFVKGLKRGGYDVEKSAAYWDAKVKELERQRNEYEKELASRKQGVEEGGVGKTHISPSGVETNMPPTDDDYAINYGKNGLVAKDRKSRNVDVKTGNLKVKEECAGVGVVTKQNSTADVGPGTIKKNLKAFKLAQEGHDDDDYVQQLTSEFIRRAKLGRRYTPAETVLGMLDRFFKKFAINDRYFDDVFHRVVRTTDHEAGMLEMQTELEEWKASRQLCRSSTPDSELGASALASCKSQGLRARDGKKSHKVGNKRITVGGHRIKGKKYGGPLPDYGTRK